MTGRSIALFVAAAIAEIGGAHLIWPAIKGHRGGAPGAPACRRQFGKPARVPPVWTA
jgi:hypothetical protein